MFSLLERIRDTSLRIRLGGLGVSKRLRVAAVGNRHAATELASLGAMGWSHSIMVDIVDGANLTGGGKSTLVYNDKDPMA